MDSRWDNDEIDKRLEKARKVTEVSGADHMNSVLEKIQTGREAKANFKSMKRKRAAKKGMRTAKRLKNAGPQMHNTKGR